MNYARTLMTIAMAATLSLPLQATEAPAPAIQANNLSWSYALNSGNVAALSQLYSDGAIVLPPTDETLNTREQIRAFWDQVLSQGFSDFSIDNIDTRVAGDTAYQAGVWSASRTDANGRLERIGGNILNVLERQEDGSWRARMQSWN